MSEETNTPKPEATPSEWKQPKPAYPGQPAVPPGAAPPPIQPFQGDFRDGLLSLFCIAAAFLFVCMVLFNGLGVSVPIVVLTVLCMSFWYFCSTGQKLSLKNLWPLPFVLLSAAAFALFQTELMLLNFLFLLAVLLYQLYLLFGRGSGDMWEDALECIKTPFRNFGKGFPAMGLLFRKNQSASKVLLALGALIVLLPLTIIVLSLLLSSDAAFSRLWETLFANFHLDLPDFVLRLLLTLPLWLLLFGFCYGLRYPRQKAPKGDASKWKLPFYVVLAAVLPILILYCLFFYSQTFYLSSIAARIFPEGFVLSEYARRGFFELCTLSAINLALVLGMGLVTKPSRALRVLQGVLAGLTLPFIALALTKMLLYIRSYDLTILRLCTSWFLILVFLIFVYLICGLFSKKVPVFRLSVVTAAVMFLLLVYVDSDRLVASYNISRYYAGQTQELDVQSLGYLSDSAVPLLCQLREDPDFTAQVDEILDRRCISLTYRDNWERFNLATARAMACLPDYRERAGTYYSRMEYRN